MRVIVVYILRFSKVIVSNFTPITDKKTSLPCNNKSWAGTGFEGSRDPRGSESRIQKPHCLATTGHGRGRDSGVPAIHAGPNHGCKKPRYLAITRHGAGDGIRTRDICLGKAALYH